MRGRPHGAALVRPAVSLVLSAGAVGLLAGLVPPGDWQQPGRLAVLAVGVWLVVRLSVVPWARWASTWLVLTDRRVQLRWGVLRRSTRDVPLGRVLDVGVRRSLGQRLVGSGTLVLGTAEGGPVVLSGVGRVHEVADEVARLVADLRAPV